jgi:tetratricopeptide (TPR) repeat protein/predicted MPP superfamily phosphohydrolase
MKAHRLRILHVSDLHLRSRAEEPDAWRRRRVLGEAWEKNLDAVRRHGPIDLLCFTGDLVQSGKAEEYAALTDFVEAMLTRLGLDRERLFVVPGNHDIDRDVAKEAWTALRGLGWNEGGALSHWMATGRPPPRIRASICDEVLARQDAYRAWVRDTLHRPELLPSAAGHPRLGYRVTLSDFPFPLHVIGLDSAWLAGDDADASKLRLTDGQVGRLCDGLDGFRLALIHHPLTDLADGGECRDLLARRVDLLLRGHLHQPRASLWSEPGRELREMAAGCLYEHDTYPNACQVIEIDLDERGQPELPYRIWFRSWASGGEFWFDDNSRYEATREGWLTWPPSSSPPSRREPPPQEVFVGREAELAALEAALLPANGSAQPVAIGALQGMPGVGKSYLADRFAHLHRDRFPGGYVKLSLNADETRSVNDLGGALATQLDVPWQGETTWERMRAKLLGARALLHIENADAETSAQATVDLVKRLDGCTLIVSGRFQGLGAGAWRQIVIATLDENQAIDLLQREAGPDLALAIADKKTLARELGYLPLALHLAAGHLRARVSVDLFLRRLRDRKNLLGIAPRNLLLDKDDRRGILSSTFDLSLDLLKKACGEHSEAWMKSFATLGHAPASGVGKSLGAAMAGLSEDDFEDLMDKAAQLSLATRSARAQLAWSVHPLLGELLRERVEQDSPWMHGMTRWFLARLPRLPHERDNEAHWARWKEIGQERDALVGWLEQMPLEDAMKVARRTQYARQNGPFAAWMSFCERVLASTDDLDIQSDALWILCGVARSAGSTDRALAAARDKMRVDKARNDDRRTAMAAGAIADIFEARGDLDEALRIRRDEQVPVSERLGDVRERAITMSKIGDIFEARRDLDEALRIRREEELPVFNRLGDIRACAVTMGKIGDILQARGDFDEALRIRREVQIPVYERLGDVRAIAIARSRISHILEGRGELDEAIRIRRDQELPVYERLGDIRELLVGRANLARLLLKRNHGDDRSEAAELLRLALRSAEGMGIPEAATIRAFQRRHELS